MRAYALALRRVIAWLVLAALPATLVVAFLLNAALPSVSNGMRAIDLHTVWVGGGLYLRGESPYPRSTAAFVPAGPSQSFVQTPVVAAAFAPLSRLPYGLVAACVPLLLAGAVVLALWLLGVRDWRCVGATFLSPAVLTSISIGTLTPLVLLGVAAAWRWRRSWGAALAAGAAIAAKLLVWPLVLWLWVTGRRRTAVAAGTVAGLLLVIAFAPLGIDATRHYLDLVRRDSELVGPLSYSLVSLVHGHVQVGLTSLEVLSALIVVAAVAYASRMQRHDNSIFASAVLASIVLSPIVHLHYLALLPAAVAVLRPRFGSAWLVPVVLWITPRQDSGASFWRTGLVIAVVAVVVAALRAGGGDVRYRPALGTMP